MDRIPYWTEHWNDIVARVIARPRLLVACDFDGTLTPIVPHPDDAWLSDEVCCLLKKVSVCNGVALAIISGRALDDLQSRVGIEDIFYAGNHGLELDAPGIEWLSGDALAHRAELVDAVALLRMETAPFPGVIVEDKHLTASVHWRLVNSDALPELHEIVTGIIRGRPGLRLADGKAVWEVRPRVEWDKGSALTHFLTRLGLTAADAIYIGDDATDEDAFKALPDALTLRVGPDSTTTAARLRLNDSGDTAAFLFCLLGARLSAHHASSAMLRSIQFPRESPRVRFMPSQSTFNQ